MGTVEGEAAAAGPGREEKVSVLVRVRPLNDKEIAGRDVSEWECVNDDTILFRSSLSVPERSLYPTAYTYDRVFGSECSTKQVYEEGAKEVALSAVNGINASIFAYGQTSSGKTYTMTGITELAVTDIYDYVGKHKDKEFSLKLSAMEIYNESVRDLLSLDSTPLRLLDDPERGTVVEKLTEERLRDRSHLQALLSICDAQRQIGETALNETSSRSHQILRLTIECSSRQIIGNNSSSTLTATVNFVDLAGSERASQSLSAGTRLKEGSHINRSLLTLGTVIRKLSKGRTGHVPFRDSKLTRILQSSLGGNARTCIICTMSPARTHFEQSRNTLLFGSCAKEVTTNAQVNIVVSDKALVKHLQREVARLESELRTSWPKSDSNSAALLRDRDFLIDKLKEEITEVAIQRDGAQSQIEKLLLLLESSRVSMTLLKKEIADLTLQRDNAQSQVEKLLRLPENSRDSMTVVEQPLEHENSMPKGYSSDDAVKKCSTPMYSSRYRRNNSAENYTRLPIHEDNRFPNVVATQLYSYLDDDDDDVEEGSNVNSEEFCREVQCIEVENSSTSTHITNASSHEENAGMLAMADDSRPYQELALPQMEKDTEEFSFVHPSCCTPPQELTLSAPPTDRFSSQSSELSRSRSCNAHPVTAFTSPWFENPKNEHTQPDEFEKDFKGRPTGFQLELPLLDYGTEMKDLSMEDSQTSARGDSGEDLNAKDVDHFTDGGIITSNSRSTSGPLDVTELQSEKQVVDGLEAKTRVDISTREVKDVGLDPVKFDHQSSLTWAAEFQRLQREIIKLWHDCNVSIVHRSFFFLTFQGDTTDSIYMEVELRRLSFLSDIFSRGIGTVENGRSLTSASRMKALCQEREMLAKRMQSCLSGHDRENLYLMWGVGLKTKHRKLQLAYRLWTDTNDMDHIADSAALVARLSGNMKSEQALREMFGLNFAPQQCKGKKLNRWTSSITAL